MSMLFVQLRIAPQNPRKSKPLKSKILPHLIILRI